MKLRQICKLKSDVSRASAAIIQQEHLQKNRAFCSVTILEVESETINTSFTIFRVGKMENTLNF